MDLVITVLILGILTSVAVPKFADTIIRYRLRSAAKQLIADIGLARRHARAKTASESISFSTTGNTYAFSSLKSSDHVSQLKKVNLSETPFLAEIGSADFNGNTAVTFNAYGIPSAGGTIELGIGGSKITVTIDAETGAASASDVTTTAQPGEPSPPPNDPPPLPPPK